jgi:hypothetical protein
LISHIPKEKPKKIENKKGPPVVLLYKSIDESMITHVNIIESRGEGGGRGSVFTCERLDHAMKKKKKKNKTLLIYPKLPPTHNI